MPCTLRTGLAGGTSGATGTDGETNSGSVGTACGTLSALFTPWVSRCFSMDRGAGSDFPGAEIPFAGRPGCAPRRTAWDGVDLGRSDGDAVLVEGTAPVTGRCRVEPGRVAAVLACCRRFRRRPEPAASGSTRAPAGRCRHGETRWRANRSRPGAAGAEPTLRRRRDDQRDVSAGNRRRWTPAHPAAARRTGSSGRRHVAAFRSSRPARVRPRYRA